MKRQFVPVLLSLAIALSACSSVPTTTSTLEQARSDYTAAQGNGSVSQYAPRELKAATDALDAANAAAADRQPLEKIDQLAYLAKQKIATAQEVARARQAEADLKTAAQQRDQVRLEARTAEAEAAKRSAEQAQADAEAARARAERERAATQSAQMQAQSAQAQAQALAAQLADLQAKQTERGTIVTLGDVLFNTDQAVLTSQGQAAVQKLASVLQQNTDRSVLVEGFTDSTGSTAHNLELSQRRAESVRNALSQMGIGRDRVEARGYGEAYPVAGNDTAGDRQLNRRVEIVLSDAGKPVQARR